MAAALVLGMLCPLRAATLDAQGLVARCAAVAGANLNGLTALRAACPGIDRAVTGLGVAGLLPAGWDKRVSAAALGDLDALVRRYAGRPASTPPAPADLRAIALRLRQPGSTPSSSPLWHRIEAWLRRRLAALSGLLRWLHVRPGGSLGPGARRALFACAGVLTLLGLAALVLTELRAAGLLGPGRHARADTRHRRRATRESIPGAARENAADADPPHALDSPASALRLLLEALRRSRRIERDGNLTCREILAHAVFDTRDQREGFATIASLAERELFGPDGARIRVPDDLRAALRALYTQLSAAPPARSAGS